jgi:hypothetical protein
MKMYVLAVLMLAAFNASATNNGSGCQGNCPSTGGGTTNNEANSHANGGNGYGGDGGNGTGVGVGVGVGLGLGGEGGKGGAGGQGGDGGSAIASGGHGGSVAGSGNSANLNSNTAKGGNASQGQLQGQQQSNVGVNSQGQSSTNVSGSKSIAQQALENSNKINASSANDNRSNASGNTTATTVNVGGDSTLVERNAPPVFLGAITPTSCGGSFNAGGSSRDGAGGFGFSWVGTECAIRQLGDRYQQMGQVDIACELYSSTKAFQKAAKRNPKLASLDCTAKPAPSAVIVPVSFPLTDRKPRG